jgi:hypothetical protein
LPLSLYVYANHTLGNWLEYTYGVVKEVVVLFLNKPFVEFWFCRIIDFAANFYCSFWHFSKNFMSDGIHHTFPLYCAGSPTFAPPPFALNRLNLS